MKDEGRFKWKGGENWLKKRTDIDTEQPEEKVSIPSEPDVPHIQPVGKHYSAGKPPWHLLPYDALEGVVGILQYGTQKYDARNWEFGIEYSEIFGSVMRHLKAWFQDREDIDPESDMLHIDHAACDILFLAAYVHRKMMELDNRPKPRK